MVAGGLHPLRASRRRSSYHLRNSTSLAAFAVLGPGSLWLILAAAVAATGLLVAASRARSESLLRRVLLHGDTSSTAVGRLLLDTGFVLVAISAALRVGSRIGVTYPLPLARLGDFFAFVACLCAGVGTLVAFTEVYYRYFAKPASRPATPGGMDVPSDTPLYWLLLVVGFPLQLTAHFLYLTYGPAVMLGGLLWFVFLTVLHDALLARRRQLLQAFHELEVSQRIVAQGEISSRIIHQMRHQLGLIGIGTHLIREAFRGPAVDPRKVVAQLDRLDGVASTLRGILSEELAPRREDEAPEGEDDSADTFLSLGKLVQDELERLQGKAEQAGILLVLQAQTEGAVSRSPAEAEQLSQAIFNVIENALAAAQSRVTVSLARQVDAYTIAIVDDGPGISPEVLPRAAEPFVTTKPDGSGMGLFIATTAARRWGGELLLENVPNGGLRATFWLPTGPRGRGTGRGQGVDSTSSRSIAG